MRKLLSANFSRLWKDRIFWRIMLGVFIFSLATILSAVNSVKTMEAIGLIRTLDDFYFSEAPYMGMFYALFISLFLGTEYSDGTLRNKLVVGHKRTNVFLANFITCFTGCLLFVGVWFLGCAPGRILIGPFEMGMGEFFTYALVTVGFTASYTAIFTWLGTAYSNKAMTVVRTLGTWLGLILIASAFNDRLNVPEMQGGMAYLNGELTMVDSTPNPLYLSGMTRTICEYILDFLPSGQAILMNDASIVHPIRQILFSLTLTTLLILAGVMCFGRNNIK